MENKWAFPGVSKYLPRKVFVCKHCGKIGPYLDNLEGVGENLDNVIDIVSRNNLKSIKITKPGANYEITVTAKDGVVHTIVITCVYRCPIHNAEVGGVPNGPHTRDLAVDWYCKEHTIELDATIAHQAGFLRVGKYMVSQFVHCDNWDIGPADFIENK